MENIEELEAKILEKVKEDHKVNGGSNGTDINELDKLINLPIPERNKLFEKMVAEKKLAYLDPLNARRITLPK
ncbi:hypothetical protein DBR39_18375 [Chryseobacterium sp. KBW03]|jgi:hypothetical protein|uniref:hypothetical protein n=1 Tax=Chryseobacterium sp. KBW03 TaxID=2153362 RepID=UPI000F5AE9D8|nr:hypothetical protein [Chryseobacterium sp. KBW03]RQO35443.1 hypothetical protein DBR39_18375 [Chryseobacterium sp. KBW03]